VAWLSRDDGSTARLAYLQDWQTATDREIEEIEQSMVRLQQILASTRERRDLITRLGQVVEEELEFSQGPVDLSSPEIEIEPSLVIDVDATPRPRVTLPASRPGEEADGRIEQIVE
jgi:hypothetical protein